MNNKKTITILKIIIALLILAACAPLAPTAEPSATYATITPEPYPAWLTSWLEKPTCDIPCWETIVPGKTTRQEAKTALSKIKGITVIQEYEVSPYGQSLLWNRGAIFFEKNDIVHLIKLDTFI